MLQHPDAQTYPGRPTLLWAPAYSMFSFVDIFNGPDYHPQLNCCPFTLPTDTLSFSPVQALSNNMCWGMKATQLDCNNNKMEHHTSPQWHKFGFKRLSGSEDMFWTKLRHTQRFQYPPPPPLPHTHKHTPNFVMVGTIEQLISCLMDKDQTYKHRDSSIPHPVPHLCYDGYNNRWSRIFTYWHTRG